MKYLLDFSGLNKVGLAQVTLCVTRRNLHVLHHLLLLAACEHVMSRYVCQWLYPIRLWTFVTVDTIRA